MLDNTFHISSVFLMSLIRFIAKRRRRASWVGVDVRAELGAARGLGGVTTDADDCLFILLLSLLASVVLVVGETSGRVC